MDRQVRINEAKQEIEVMFEGLNDSDTADIVVICQNAIETIEMRRAKKLRVFKKFYKPLPVSDTQKSPTSTFTSTRHSPHWRNCEIWTRKNTKKELNFQVMIAEQKEHLEDLENGKQYSKPT
ncbi:hypothetical protein BOTNAR_0658g00010 [Botryotinia narcissicola]|uniref:Uncharacterized protein n=1 Tax=Botryotinia narcissicola TaxID=278944 RepID=A0A4Z1HFI3_9HELO|nr:hypothetical protein BOTNAR_0658g00010 [Botryotinia narcissicola]